MSSVRFDVILIPQILVSKTFRKLYVGPKNMWLTSYFCRQTRKEISTAPLTANSQLQQGLEEECRKARLRMRVPNSPCFCKQTKNGLKKVSFRGSGVSEAETWEGKVRVYEAKVSLVDATLRTSLSGIFLQTLPELVPPLKGHSIYLRAAVRRHCQRPPKGLGTKYEYI